MVTGERPAEVEGQQAGDDGDGDAHRPRAAGEMGQGGVPADRRNAILRLVRHAVLGHAPHGKSRM